MSSRYGKGSIIFKLIIVVLSAVLIFSIYYPKKLWEAEKVNTDTSRYRMEALYNANLMYQRFQGTFTDTMDQIISFLQTDSAYHAWVDSAVGGGVSRFITIFDSMKTVQSNFEDVIRNFDPTDSLSQQSFNAGIDAITTQNRFLRDRMENLREEMKLHPYAPLASYDRALEVIERKDFFLNYEIIKNMVAQSRTQEAMDASSTTLDDYQTMLDNLRQARTELGGMYAMADSLRNCPTTGKPYHLTIQPVDSGSVILEVIVSSPIDSLDVRAVEQDFLRSTVGALTLENHGTIRGGEKSWESKR